MDYRIAPARRLSRTLTALLAAAGLLAVGIAVTPSANAQTPPAKPAAPAAKKPAAPAAKPAEAAPAPQQPAADQPQLLHSPWTKICQNGPETGNKQVCAIGTQAQIETGQPIVLLQLLEPDGGEKLLRVILPIPVRVQNGTRILIDQQELAKAPFAICGAQTGCIADYKVDPAVIAKLKAGKELDVQLFNVYNNIVSLPIPLTDFGKAYDGPPLDPNAFAEQQRKLQEELQKKAEAARKSLEGKQQPATAAPAPAQKK